MAVLVPGSTLADRYVVEGLIGSGSSTEVYRAEDRRLGRTVAIKMLVDGRLVERSRQRFRAEIEALQALDHEAIIRVLDTGEADDGRPFFVMELVEGGTLRDLLDREGTLSPERLHILTTRLASALGVVHRRHLVHGDVKPDNVFLPGGEVQRAKLGDFGLVDAVSERSGLTVGGVILGTPRYMSPEQAIGQSRSAASDVWALGVVLFECAYGRQPFGGSNVQEVALQILTGEPSFEPLPGGLERVIARALAKDPAKRFPSMVELAEALQPPAGGAVPDEPRMRPVTGASPPVLEPVPAAAWPSSVGSPAPEGSKARRSSVGPLVVGAAVLVVVVVLVLVQPLSGDAATTVVRLVFGLALGVVAAALVYGLLGALERRGGPPEESVVVEGAARVRRRATATDVLSQSLAVTMDSLLSVSAADPAIDLRRVSLALAIDDFQGAKDREDQRQALERAIQIADKLREQIEQQARPWYLRHKEALTLVTALLAAITGLVAGFGSLFGE
ncbi:MAG: protein kinase [Myxococcales bacterium]|nr:protein kinase [Myxococcales bacterium]MCB9714112.1 protein kinase [Myxococcales bacterium]